MTWNSFKGQVVTGVKAISAKTEELTRVGRLKLEVVAIKRNLEQMMVELGGRIYHKVQNNDIELVPVDDEVKQIVARIKGLEEKLEIAKQKLETIRNDSGVDID